MPSRRPRVEGVGSARRRPLRRLLRLVALLAVTVALAFGGANALVLLGSRGQYGADAARQPHAQAALVLGARVLAGGTLSDMLTDRVVTAVELYRGGRVDKLLLSGDHGRDDYDEVGAMRAMALRLGVAPQDVFTDHAGFDTWDSMVRARKVFGVERAIVVTQRFHLPRAVWLARRAGLEAGGVSADRRSYGVPGTNSTRREWLARPKAVLEAMTGRDPRFLGPRIPITGDGRVSWG
jgi:SanA protein